MLKYNAKTFHHPATEFIQKKYSSLKKKVLKKIVQQCNVTLLDAILSINFIFRTHILPF